MGTEAKNKGRSYERPERNEPWPLVPPWFDELTTSGISS